MNIHAHKRTLGVIHIVYGFLTALCFVFIGVIISSFAPFIAEAIVEENGEEAIFVLEVVANVLKIFFTLIFIFSALPSIFAGIGLLANKSWAMVVALIAGCVSILSFPFGTVIGVYSIFVYIQHNKEKKHDENQG